MADIQNQGLAGYLHLQAISKLLCVPIDIYNESGVRELQIEHRNSKKTPIEIQFHSSKKHYTILNNKEPFSRGHDDQMCLYNCISDHTNIDPNILKSLTLDFLQRAVIFCDLNIGLLYSGGASYRGVGRSDATWYLSSSQGVQGYRFPRPGHPRHHASNPAGVGVESASREEGFKTGFESYGEQDFVAHYALQTRKAQAGMESLNGGKTRMDMHILSRELCLPRSVNAGRWDNGVRNITFAVKTVVLVLQHRIGQFNNPDAPVHIQTFYPLIPD